MTIPPRCSTPSPEMILQGQDIPIHLGSLMPAMKAVAAYFGDDIHEGDLILHNDPAYRRQPHHRHLHVQAGVLQGQAHLLDGVQGPYDRYRRAGARRLQPQRQGNLRRVPAHPAGQDLGPRQAAQRRAQHDAHQHAGAARPGRRFQRPDRRLPGRRAQPPRHARQVRRQLRSRPASTSCSHGRPAHARADPRRCRTAPISARRSWRMPATASAISRSPRP